MIYAACGGRLDLGPFYPFFEQPLGPSPNADADECGDNQAGDMHLAPWIEFPWSVEADDGGASDSGLCSDIAVHDNTIIVNVLAPDVDVDDWEDHATSRAENALPLGIGYTGVKSALK